MHVSVKHLDIGCVCEFDCSANLAINANVCESVSLVPCESVSLVP